MQDVVKKNKRLAEPPKHNGGSAFGAKRNKIKKRHKLDSDVEVIQEIMGDKFHY